MSGGVYAALVLVIWVSLGVSTVVIFFARHGRRSWPWFAIGVALGPILLPIAAEMDRRGDRLLRWDMDDRADREPPPTLTVLGAIDGSFESDRALREVGRMLGGFRARIVLVTVLDPDLAGPNETAAARTLLEERAAWLMDLPVSVRCEVVAGDPVQMILECAAANDIDLLFLGRRGKGMSRRLLGSVADRLVKLAPRPVLLGAPVAPGIHRAQRDVDVGGAQEGAPPRRPAEG